MRALLINAVCGVKSTGRICIDIAKKLEAEGYEVKIGYGRDEAPAEYSDYAVKIGSTPEVYWHGLMSKTLDERGYWSICATKSFLKWANEYNPDLLWLHNLHDSYINLRLLFDWIKSRPQMIVKWTQHDCWAFTGSCFHYTCSKCEAWRNECQKCPSKKLISNSPLIRTPARNFKNKKEWFTGVEKMELIAPSEWLAAQLKKSFLSCYPVSVVHNEIDTKAFKPTPSDFRERLGLADKHIILGVASVWSRMKGLEDFIKLSKMLNENEIILLVGLNDKQISALPKGIIAVKKTNDCAELAEIYTAADVFVNLTYEDTYPTVNLEAQACGTPCITYRTGGSTESVPEENVIEVGDLEALLIRIRALFNG